jgi:hypothetical protein
VLVENDGRLTGSVTAGDRLFRVEPTGAGTADLVELDGTKIVRHTKEPVAPDILGPGKAALPSGARAASAGGDDGSTIDVLVVHDTSAPSAVADIRATAQLSVDDYNARLDNAGIANGHERLVAAVGLQHAANQSDWGGELTWLTSDATVAKLRDQYKADLVQELIGSTSAGIIGIGWIGPSQSHAHSVVKAYYAAYGAAHEKGHNMGGRHNVEEDPSAGAYPYGHGYCGPGFYTTMSYQESRCGTAAKIFSTPNKTVNGAPAGNASQADMARLLTTTAPVVAAFEQSGTVTPPPAQSWSASATVSPSATTVGQTATAAATATSTTDAPNRRLVVKYVAPDGSNPKTCSAIRDFAAGTPQRLSCAYAPAQAGAWTVWIRVLDAATGAEVYRLKPAARLTVSP